MGEVSEVFRCRFCPCVFCSQSDLNSHLKVFGDVSHLDIWRCTHVLLEDDGFLAGVDSHGEWHWHDVSYHSNTVRVCRKLLALTFKGVIA